jgi:predicted nucleic acid-binding protein
MILVDSNVLLDLVTDDPIWADWSERQLRLAAAQDELAINEMVFAEVSVRYSEMQQVAELLRRIRARFVRTPSEALFLAGKTFQRYRMAGGARTGVLPDFFIGAHAQLANSLLLTRDTARYRTYFPAVMLIAPAPN